MHYVGTEIGQCFYLVVIKYVHTTQSTIFVNYIVRRQVGLPWQLAYNSTNVSKLMCYVNDLLFGISIK